jgi:hypothetical protein
MGFTRIWEEQRKKAEENKQREEGEERRGVVMKRKEQVGNGQTSKSHTNLMVHTHRVTVNAIDDNNDDNNIVTLMPVHGTTTTAKSSPVEPCHPTLPQP